MERKTGGNSKGGDGVEGGAEDGPKAEGPGAGMSARHEGTNEHGNQERGYPIDGYDIPQAQPGSEGCDGAPQPSLNCRSSAKNRSNSGGSDNGPKQPPWERTWSRTTGGRWGRGVRGGGRGARVHPEDRNRGKSERADPLVGSKRVAGPGSPDTGQKPQRNLPWMACAQETRH
jgi:hypothetical protein